MCNYFVLYGSPTHTEHQVTTRQICDGKILTLPIYFIFLAYFLKALCDMIPVPNSDLKSLLLFLPPHFGPHIAQLLEH